jgi:DNA polymerase-3 subunit epsilon
MHLELQRPLVFFDFETTGLDTQKDRIVELAFIRLNADGSRESLVRKARLPQGIVMSPAASRITGIQTADAQSMFWGPPLKDLGKEILAFVADGDLAGFNILGYDLPLWLAECKRHGIPFEQGQRKLVDVKVIFNVLETGWDRFTMGPRNLSAAVRHYCGKVLEGAHGAEADTNATIDVLLAQMQRYPDLPRTAAGLHEFCSRNSEKNREELSDATLG